MEIIYKHFITLSSTNAVAKELLKELPKGSLLLVSAGEQTAGKGQYGRHWHSPKGENVYATYGFLAEKNQPPLTLTHLLALSTASALKEWKLECRIKWPNDLLIQEKKIAGILCETIDFGTHFGIVIGIGLNVNSTAEEFKELERPVTSIFLETGEHVTPQFVLTKITQHFTPNLTLFLEQGFAPFEETFQKLLLSKYQ